MHTWATVYLGWQILMAQIFLFCFSTSLLTNFHTLLIKLPLHVCIIMNNCWSVNEGLATSRYDFAPCNSRSSVTRVTPRGTGQATFSRVL